MLTIQEMFDIAMRYATAMADAMVAACVAKSVELGVRLEKPRAPRPRPFAASACQPPDDVDWERMVVGNTDTARNHC